MSSAAQKARPEPVTTTTRTASSIWNWVNASVMSRFIGWVVPLRCSGSFIVTVATPWSVVVTSKPLNLPSMPGSVTTRSPTGVASTADFDRALRAVIEIGPLAAEQAAAAEAQRFLTEPVVEALRDSGLTAVLVPTALGGGGLTLPQAIEVFRAMAEYDASTAWTLAILANSGLIGRFLARPAFEELLADGALLAGSLNPLAATVVPAPGGVRVSGRAPCASGCHHARWLLVAGWMHRDGERSFVDGVPELVASVLPIGHATITDSWH